MSSGGLLRWCCVVLITVEVASGLIVNAPEKCGSEHVALHAAAFFGPTASRSGLHDVGIFAAYPEKEQESEKIVVRSRAMRRYDGMSSDRHLFYSILTRTPWGGKTTYRSLFGRPSHLRDSASTAKIERLTDGCRRFTAKENVEGVKGKVAVVIRGECDYGTKVFNMQQDGAAGVIVVNDDVESDHLRNMKLNSSNTIQDYKVPAVMIGYPEWRLLAPCRNENNISVSFTADGEAGFDIDYGKDVLTWAMMRGMALWLLLQCGVNAVRFKRRHSDLTARAEAIAGLPSYTYCRGDNTLSPNSQSGANASLPNEDPICAICLEGFNDGDQARYLECSHLYHRDCIDLWLAQSSSCPVCKRDIANLPPPLPSHFYGSVSPV
eukprot:CAMPEP_0198733904 /NCGR_PEP_ID=MMETSP1475-20131203/49058_1 /TAXON_ID= ORGANISM="Unidentified sp., Strain CCMP1999" /NCGR_SAMPLE_ID=MMETSP1475 /ASSEMBLY_ACC=CAM_ASM_001111 /LENGTH=378 /DNA_ID=CAMNT_0044497277 /DNA_START=162 /DNA_END=1298 /DNA_ORIENTATION=+